jgi:hypothetical protein
MIVDGKIQKRKALVERFAEHKYDASTGDSSHGLVCLPVYAKAVNAVGYGSHRTVTDRGVPRIASAGHRLQG